MDRLLRRLTSGPNGRIAVAVLVLVGAAVLSAAVLIASASAGGTTASVPPVSVERSATASPTPLLVQVSGAVRRPGLVSVPPGARVVDAVAAAGGPSAKADQGAVNLAAPVADGQQVIVPERGAAAVAATAPAGTGAATVSLNTATAEQLETLPRIGPALATRILAYRAAHGPFHAIDDLGEVGGIGPKTLEGLRPMVTL